MLVNISKVRSAGQQVVPTSFVRIGELVFGSDATAVVADFDDRSIRIWSPSCPSMSSSSFRSLASVGVLPWCPNEEESEFLCPTWWWWRLCMRFRFRLREGQVVAAMMLAMPFIQPPSLLMLMKETLFAMLNASASYDSVDRVVYGLSQRLSSTIAVGDWSVRCCIQ